jgi:hypothetical protein
VTLLAPWMLAVAVAVAAGAIALHLIAWDRPEPSPLPTARFIPPPQEIPAARRRHLSDLLLLLLRIAIILLLGLALARPLLTPEQDGRGRVVVADFSAASDVEAVRQALAPLTPDASRIIAVDSGSADVASGSAALVLGIRAAASLGTRPESTEIILMSPLLQRQVDEALPRIRAVWPGPVQVHRVRARSSGAPDTTRRRLHVPETSDDPVLDAARLVTTRTSARLIRRSPTAEDSVFARSGGSLIHWPHAQGSRIHGALIGEGALAVGRFGRPALPAAPEARAVLWWPDGAAAGFETPLHHGCLRTVHAAVPEGDAALRSGFLSLLGELASLCRHADAATATDSLVRALERSPVARAAIAPEGVPLAPWLLVVVLALSALEFFLRRRP